MSNLRDAAEMTLEALDSYPLPFQVPAKEALRQALAQPEWVGLTDEEIGWVWHNSPPNSHEYARAIEAKLKEKNT